MQYANDQCIGVTFELVKEFARHFLAHDSMNPIRIIYPQYWEEVDAKVTFVGHLVVLKSKFCHPKSKSPNVTLVVGLLDGALLDEQTFFFTITMKNNSHGTLHPPPDCNPTTKMWARFIANVIVAHKLSKFFKLVEIAIVMVVGSVKDDKTFSTINFMKSKLCNHLTTHLDLVVQMYVQKFYKLKTFPFYTIIKEWGKHKLQYGEE